MLVELKGYSYTYPGEVTPALAGVDLCVGRGECHVITGPTGSGKSTLGLAVRGLLPQGGSESGMLRRVSGEVAGLVFQNPETQLLCRTVGSEAAFGLENLCVEPGAMGALVRDALSSVGLDKEHHAASRELSMGQKYRLVMASHLAMKRKIIILDEPAGQLDPDGIARLCAIINRLKKDGVSFIVFDHDAWAFRDAADFSWRLGADGLTPDTPAAPVVKTYTLGKDRVAGETVIHAAGLCAPAVDGGPVWSDTDFSLSRGGLVAISGPNGSGKTTMLKCIMGLAKPSKGMLSVFGDTPTTRNVAGRAGCLLQDPHAQLFEDTVIDEAAFMLRRSGIPRADAIGRAERALELCGIARLAGRSPHKLSYGQKRLVALASVMSHRPELLLLDDPFSGLDPARRRDMFSLFNRLAVEDGTAVVWTTHNTNLPGIAPDNILRVEDGKVAEHSC